MNHLKRVARRLPPFARLVQDRDRLQSELDRWKRWQGFPPGHFYSPIPDLDDVGNRQQVVFDRTRRDIPGIDLRWERQIALLRELAQFYGELPFASEPTPGCRYHYNNQTFCQGDAIALYSMLRKLRPQRVVEVGSGFSSAVMLDTAERFLPETRFSFIEPYPERLQSLMKPDDAAKVRLFSTGVVDVDRGVFDELQSGDILFIDSSHVAKAGSDVGYLVFEIIPRLRPGVYVHFHDIFYPFEYPAEWVLRGWSWNEAYLVRSFLQFNPVFEIEFWGSALAQHHHALLAELLPRALENTGASLWLRRRDVHPHASSNGI
ncbi:MAG: class I SAM-dependent methyltransferase [Planctomycetaceae bacterium]|nr:class I SAM-dependent methyltransferase [Planctomycetaceae bacterium]